MSASKREGESTWGIGNQYNDRKRSSTAFLCLKTFMILVILQIETTPRHSYDFNIEASTVFIAVFKPIQVL